MTDPDACLPPDAEAPGADELVPEDDTIIGTAFRWSLGVVAVAAAATLLVVWALDRPETAVAPNVADRPRPLEPVSDVEPPTLLFADVTSAAGIDFVHFSGAAGEKLLPETMGGGCAFLDYDGDGDQDLLLVNGRPWPWSAASPVAPTSALYRNDGTGHYENVTASCGLDASLHGMGAAVGDYDNDGDPDLYLTAVGPNRLLRNDGGFFRDVTDSAGIAGSPQDWSTSAGFFDADADGDLDLFVCNYVRWSREIDFAVGYRLTGIGRAYGPPNSFQGSFCDLFRNDGDGTFTDVSRESGIEVVNPDTGVPVAKALGVAFADPDGDGLPDLFVANDTVRNFLFHNRGGCRFEEAGAEAGLAYGPMGQATGAMGIDAADYRNDASLGVAIGNFANEMSSLYVSQRDPWSFVDQAIGEGIGAPSRKVLSFGLFFFDCDLDGRLDLLQANGHLEAEINTVQPSQHYRQAPQLFYNAGPAARHTFVEVDPARLGDLASPLVGRGAAYADIDGDGDLDVLLTEVGGRPRLLRNDQALGHHWLRVRLAGTSCNRDAIGALVELAWRPDGPGGALVVQRRQVAPTRSYLSAMELPLTMGLGRGARVESLRVRWPGGGVQDVAVDRVDTTITVRQAQSR
jgi:hypothetical protein